MNWIERDIGPIVRKTSNNSDLGAIALVHYDDKPGTGVSIEGKSSVCVMRLK